MPSSGDLLGDRYRILAPLGAGGMATVYRANDERLGREVAVKVLSSNRASDPGVATRFEREARTLATAAHPGVVSIFDVDAGDPLRGREPFFVMELCPGGSLADRLADGQRVSPDALIPALVSIADGLADLHARGLVHRDVKPSNILFAADRAKLADFGLARGDEDDLDDQTSPGIAVGTVAYLAPEVLAGEKARSAADIYALGVAAFAGLTGALPRPATSLAELAATTREPARTVSAAAPDLGPTFDEPIAAALAADPDERPDGLDFASSMTAALGRWGRTKAPVGAIAAPSTHHDLATDATTAISLPTVPPRVAEPVPDGAASDPRRWLGPAVMAIAVIALGGLALWGSLGNAPRTGSPTPSPPPNPSEVATLAPAVAPSVPATQPTVRPTTPAVIARALTALEEVDAAIRATTGRGGLQGKERNDLQDSAAAIRAALDDGDVRSARAAAEALAERFDQLKDEMDEDRTRQLIDAVRTLTEALGS